jgi:hypothetical protein
MTRYIGPESVEVWWVTTVSDPLAPTSAELNAGVDLTGFLVADGADFPQSARTVDASDGSSRRDKVIAGTYGGDEATLTAHREAAQADDTAFTTLPAGTIGYVAIAARPLATAGTWATGDEVDLWPAEVINRENANLMSRTATQQFTAGLAITGDVTEDYSLLT